MRIATLLTAFNRRELTLSAIHSLLSQSRSDFAIDVFIVDDGSTDGTGDAIRQNFPSVHLLTGDGSLFWCGGMRLAFSAAQAQDFDAYLLLNDDTDLLPGSLERLAASIDKNGNDHLGTIAVGTVRDPRTGLISYGGWTRSSRVIRSKLKRTPVGDHVCDTFNANCVMISRGAAQLLGNLDANFTHGMGDLDYGFRANAIGIEQCIVENVGLCEANPGIGMWTDTSQDVRLRWKNLLGPKGLPPREWFVYCRRHSGVLWPAVWLWPYLSFWLRHLLAQFKGR